MTNVHLNIDDIEKLTHQALRGCNTNEMNCRSVTRSVVAAELDGIHSHGLARLPTYCEHARCGKINGNAQAELTQLAPSALRTDAMDGFAHPAIDLGIDALVPLARQQGIAALAVVNSYNCGVLGYHVEKLAGLGMLALGFTNAPASIAPAGGVKAVLGTNPIACAVPDGKNGAQLIIDQSSSVVAKSELMVHKDAGEPIPEGWAMNNKGQPTTDAEEGLAGSMVAAGGYKGASLALLVELMAAGLTGANLGIQASSFADNNGESPRTGQFFIAINTSLLCTQEFQSHIQVLLEAMLQDSGTRLPGQRRIAGRKKIASEGIQISSGLHEKLLAYASQ